MEQVSFFSDIYISRKNSGFDGMVDKRIENDNYEFKIEMGPKILRSHLYNLQIYTKLVVRCI